jgi:hypothetical protein
MQGNAAGGVNADFGIYDFKGNRIVSSGSTAQTANVTIFELADTTLAPGYYFMGYAAPSGDHFAASHPIVLLHQIGMREMASALPLPATATFAALQQAFYPQYMLHVNPNAVL